MKNTNMDNKIALIYGITGQDGSYLSELLLSKGYIVHGVIRRSSSFNTGRIDHLMGNENYILHYGDVTDPQSVNQLVSELKPNEIYNLSAQSHVAVSFEIPHYTANVDAIGTLNILEAIRLHSKDSKFYQASTSELYGGMSYNKNKDGFYNENSPFHPRSPYGVAKLYGYWIVKNYRESYNIFACNGILFNHESPRRGKTFVTRKITTNLVQVFKGKRETLKLGNLYSLRDWGHAKDYVYGMWLMLQREDPKDYVLSSGESYMVKDFVNITAEKLGYKLEWKGSGIDEKAYDINSGKLIVEIDERYFRPAEVDHLLGDSSLAREELGWNPKYNLVSMIDEMVEYDLKNE